MQTNRIWAIGAAFIIVLILALGFFLGIAPKLTEAGAAETNTTAVNAQNTAQEAVIAHLKDDFANIDGLNAQLAALRQSIPANADVGPFITDLHTLENASKVTITSITPADPMGFIPAPPVLGEPTPTTTAPAADATATAAPVDPAAPVADPAAPTESLPETQFLTMNVNIEVTGTQSRILDFVDELQTTDRLFLVTNLTIQGDPQDANAFIGKISGSIYVLLDPEAAAAAATATDPAAPAATATPAP